MGTNVTVGDGSGYLALPAGGSGPGLLLLHAWWGLKPFFVSLADRYAEQGYVVLAPDLNFGEIVSTVPDAEALQGRRDHERIAKLVSAASETLSAQEKLSAKQIGVLGFSLGAAWALWLASEQPEKVAAVSLFYGTYAVDFAAARAAYQGHFGENDEWEPLDSVQAMEADLKAAGRSTEFYTYPNAAHWFCEPDRPEFLPDAAALAWQRTDAFFARLLQA